MALLPEGSRQSRDVRLLGEEASAADAFARLWMLVRDRLIGAVVRAGLSLVDAEDVVQAASARLWERRAELADMSVGGFWAFAFRVSRNLAIDQSRRLGKVETVQLVDEIHEADMEYVDVLVEAALDRDLIYAAADRLWLGECEEGKMTTLALQLRLAEDVSVEEAAAILRIDPAEVERAASDPVQARYALFHSLVWSGEDLASYVLSPDDPPSAEKALRLLRRAMEGEVVSVGSWRSLEVAVVVLRARFGMSSERILRALPGSMRQEEIVETLARAKSAYPFSRIAERAAFVLRPSLDEALRGDGLWRRMVFDYHVRSQLPHKQIIERIAPAATALSTEIKPTTLNSWIGNGRLWTQLAAFIASERTR